MVTKLLLDKPFQVFKIPPEDLILLQFHGYFGNICDDCNKVLNDDVYLICVLNYGVCKNCFEEWYQRAAYYTEDEKYENALASQYVSIMKSLGIEIEEGGKENEN